MAAGIALSLLILAVGVMVPMVATGVALAVDIIRANLATAVATKIVPAYVVKIGFYGIASTSVFAPIALVARNYETIKAKKYAWMLPILGVLARYAVDFCKEYYPGDQPFLRITVGAITLIVFYIAGVVWDLRGTLNRIIGMLLFLLPPVTVFLFVAEGLYKEGLRVSWSAMPTQVLLSVGVFLFLVLVAVMLARKYEKT
jgi:hypothetical protein